MIADLLVIEKWNIWKWYWVPKIIEEAIIEPELRKVTLSISHFLNHIHSIRTFCYP
jgi:hypothetical protein